MTTTDTTPSTLSEIQNLYEQTTRNMDASEILLIESQNALPLGSSKRLSRARELFMKMGEEKVLFRALESGGGSGSEH